MTIKWATLAHLKFFATRYSHLNALLISDSFMEAVQLLIL